MIRQTLLSAALAAACSTPAYAISVDDINQLGNGLDVTYGVLDNTQDDWRTFRGEIAIANSSNTELPASAWSPQTSKVIHIGWGQVSIDDQNKWAETVRTEEQFEGMVFPRLLGVAERAWHRAPWEANDITQVVVDEAGRNTDYNHLANLVCYK